MNKIMPPPLPEEQKVINNFDKLVSELKSFQMEPKVKDLKKALEEYYNNESNFPKIDDEYPSGLEPYETKSENPFLPPIFRFPLYEEIKKILKEYGILLEGAGVDDYFKIGGKVLPEIHGKFYCCLKTKDSIDFAKKLGKFANNSTGITIEGKFYELDSFNAHNKLVFYTSLNNSFIELAKFLKENEEYFHRIPFNHPFGVHIFDGVSAVIERTYGKSFDENLYKIIREEKEQNTKKSFISNAIHELTENPVTRPYFLWSNLKSAVAQYNGESIIEL
ncbi:MAG: hypothetical protein QW469_01500 [Candidatus Aenigmatarchaeota archaeon]